MFAVVVSTMAISADAGLASSLDRDELDRRLDRFASKAGGVAGVTVHDLEADRKLSGHRASRRRVLASNTKLFTTAAALGRFGAERRLATTIHADGRIERRTLRGDLYLVGDGDPTLGGRQLARAGIPQTPIKPLARAVKRAGIRKVAGRLYADDTIFDRVRGVPYSDWGPTDELRGPLGGLTYNTGWAAGDPAIAAATVLRRKLRKIGVKVRRIKLGALPARLQGGAPLAAAPSPRMARLVAQTNRVSDNTFAEMLLKRVAARSGRKGTTKRGVRVAERFAAGIGSGASLADGSGLSSANRASASQVAALLDGMRSQPAFRAFWNSLPKAGLQGTLYDRLRGTVAEGRCRAKTGTIDGVSTLSGYCTTKAEKRLLAFSILMNGVDIDRARTYQDRIVKSIARYEA